jgi:hypothetical protein
MSQLQVTGEAKIRDIQGPVVANSGVITALDGAANQYVRGDGTLASFPTSGGGGSSVSYYLNGSVNQGTFGGSTYYQMSKNAIVGTGTNFSTSANGLIAQFITDANDPDVVSIPSGNWNIEFFMSVSASSGALASFYVEIYKYNGSTFTLLATNVATPEQLTNTTTVDAYFTSVAMPLSAMAITDRLAVRVFANVASKTVTLYTEDNRLCQIVTTFSKGMLSLNNLTDQSQYLTTGTSGTDFNIVSSGDTHTFNIPSASASNRGLITTGAQTIAGAKVFDNPITANSGIGFLNGVMPNITSNLYSGIGGNSQGISIITRPVSTNYTNNFYFPSASNSYTFPNATGTIALTSDISYPVTSVFGRTGAVVAVSGDYTTTQVTEGTNLYFTDARSRAALSFTAGSGAYNSTTGVITIPTDNNQIANGAGYITSSALSGYLPLSGGTLTGGLNGTTATFSGLGTFYQLTMTGATAGRLFYAQTGGVFSQSGNLVWNNSTEQLGVGTPNPSAVVTAFSTNAATQLKAAGTAPAITFSNTLTSASLACVFGLATANNHFITGTAPGDMAIANQSTSAGAIVFGTGTFEKMRMTAAGTFSIGNTNSTYNLDVTGTGRFTSTLLLGGALSGTSATFSSSVGIGISPVVPTGTGKVLQISNTTIVQSVVGSQTLFGDNVYYNGSGWQYLTSNFASAIRIGALASGEFSFHCAPSGSAGGTPTNWDTTDIKMVIKTNGNVGIGTSSPSFKLDLQNAGTFGIRLNNTGDGADTYIQYNNVNSAFSIGINSDGWFSYTGGTKKYDWWIANVVRMTLSNTGQLKITQGGNGFVADGLGFINTSGNAWNLVAGGDNNFYIGYNFSAVGYFSSSTGAYVPLSDTNKKKDFEQSTIGLNAIMGLKPTLYRMKTDKTEGNKELGFIAQEVKEFIPQAYVESEKFIGLNYNAIVAALVKSVQELKAELDELKNK